LIRRLCHLDGSGYIEIRSCSDGNETWMIKIEDTCLYQEATRSESAVLFQRKENCSQMHLSVPTGS